MRMVERDHEDEPILIDGSRAARRSQSLWSALAVRLVCCGAVLILSSMLLLLLLAHLSDAAIFIVIGSDVIVSVDNSFVASEQAVNSPQHGIANDAVASLEPRPLPRLASPPPRPSPQLSPLSARPTPHVHAPPPPPPHASPPSPFGYVRTTQSGFTVDGAPFRFVGINMWQAAWVAAASPARLQRELDVLRAHGITVLRITALSEGAADAPLQASPALQPSPGVFDPKLAEGLDLVLHELRARNMRAVLVLNNQWTWSGGMAMYLVWARGGSWRDIPYPSSHLTQYWDPVPEQSRPHATNADWDRYQKWASAFYSTPAAVALADAAVRWMLQRRNTYSGMAYAEDPTILGWELCNEPRAVSDESGRLAARLALIQWVRSTAALVKRHAPRQLVMVGSEGTTPFGEYINVDFEAIHKVDDVDAVTIHIWPENWGWGDASSGARLASAVAHSLEYLDDQVQRARALGKPLVLEEFGLARDAQRADAEPGHTTRRNAYYAAMLRAAEAHGVAGVMPWGWGGSGRQRVPGAYWRVGDDFIGDPPHESQGWYSVYDGDTSTLELLRQGFSVGHVPPMPPDPPTPPPIGPVPVCHSNHEDDAYEERCEGWCTDNSHCTYCKCQACRPLCADHPVGAAGAPCPRHTSCPPF